MGICKATFQNLQQRLDQDATVRVGGFEGLHGVRVPIPRKFDQHLFRRDLRDGRCNGLVGKAVDVNSKMGHWGQARPIG